MMRRFLLLACCGSAASALAQSPAPVASPAPAASPAPPPFRRAAADPKRGAALMDKAVAAHGGAAAIGAVERIEFRGSSVRILPGQEPIAMASVTHFVLPDLYRHELATKAGPISSLLNKEGAFVVLASGALPLPAPEAAALRTTSRRNLLVLLRSRARKDFRAARVGEGRAGATALEMVEVDLAGEKTVLGIDPGTGLVRQAVYSMPMGGKTVQVVASYSDFRPLANGVKYPFVSEGLVDGQPTFSVRLESVVVNGAIDPSLFVAPAAPAQMPGFPAPAASDAPSSNAAPSPLPSPSPR